LIKKSKSSLFSIKITASQKFILFLTFVTCFVFQLIFLSVLRKYQYKNEVAAAKAYGESVVASILLPLDQSIDITQTLKSLYLEYDEFFVDNFDRICGCLADGNYVVGSLYVAPKGIIETAYPDSIKKTTVGFNMLQDEEQGPRAKMAVETKQVTVAGPHRLIEGGSGFIIRNPIFEENEFKAFTIVVLDWNSFVSQVLKTVDKKQTGFVFGVWNEDEHIVTDSNGYIISNCDRKISTVVDIPIEVPNDVWHLSVEPAAGWTNFNGILVEFIVSVFVVLTIVCVAYYRQLLDARQMYIYEHDSLTGLLTRSAYHRRVRKLFKDNPDQSYDVMVADIQNFKVVNSIYGTTKCDELLCYLADCFSKAANNIYCSRYGGDQFAFIFKSEDNAGLKYLEEENEKYIANAPIKNIVIKYGYYGSVDKSVPVNLISDRALMAVKSILHNYEINVANYEGPVSRRHLREQMLESSFESSLNNGDFKVWYQPKFNAKTEKLVGAEALVRWEPPEGNTVSPADFIYVFEDDGLISRLDEYVFTTVCENIKEMRDEGFKVVPVSVNLSRISLHHKGIVQKYANIVKRVGIPIETISLEITETSTYGSSEMIELSNELKSAGFRLDMDDFGTGSSSLASLNILPFDVIKIDKSLIDFIGTPGGEELVKHTIELAHFKNMHVIAEGVETKEQLEFLRNLDCDTIQGYYFSAPMPYAKCLAYFKDLSAKGRVQN